MHSETLKKMVIYNVWKISYLYSVTEESISIRCEYSEGFLLQYILMFSWEYVAKSK